GRFAHHSCRRAALVQGCSSVDPVLHHQIDQAVAMRVQALAAALLAMYGANLGDEARTTASFFIASDCPISNAYAPETVRIGRRFEANGVSCRLIYEDAKVDAALMQKHMLEYHLAGMLATEDHARKLADAAHVTITPTVV